ncbi:unnamed protein product, partial [Didymodactylos carnosus]
LGLSIDYCDIENAHRIPIRLLAPDNIGSSLAKTAHPVLIARFYSRPLWHTVLAAKSNLKYLNDRHPLKYINIVEDLSKRNATIYRLARAKLSKQNKHKIYSSNGRIYYHVSSKKKIHLKTVDDIDNITKLDA